MMNRILFILFLFVALFPTQAFAVTASPAPVPPPPTAPAPAQPAQTPVQITTFNPELPFDAGKQAIEIKAPSPRINLPGLHFTAEDQLSKPTEEEGKRILHIPYLGEYIAAVYKYAVAIASILAVVMIIVGGFQWTASGGSPDAITSAKKRIVNAVTGLVIALGSYTLLYTINPELVQFRTLDVAYVEPIPIPSTENSGDVITNEDLSAPRTGTNNVPLFKQSDFQQPYGRCGTIKSSGCGPTSMAMVLKFYNASIDPLVTANTFATEGYRACPNPDNCNCQGTSYAAFTNSSLLTQNNLTGEELRTDTAKITDILKKNQPVIAVVNAQAKGITYKGQTTKFTNGGHYIVLTGVDANGNILINDPAKAITSAKPSELFTGLKGAWYIHK